MAYDLIVGKMVAGDCSMGCGLPPARATSSGVGDMLSSAQSAAITVDQAARGDADSKSMILAWRDDGDAGDARKKQLWDAGTEYASRRYGKSLDEIVDAQDVVEPLPIAPKPPSSRTPRKKIWTENPGDSSGLRDDKMVEALGDKWKG